MNRRITMYDELEMIRNMAVVVYIDVLPSSGSNF
jgi:hypothetical protein